MVVKQSASRLSEAPKQQARGGRASGRTGESRGRSVGGTGGTMTVDDVWRVLSKLEKDSEEIKGEIKDLRKDVHNIDVKVTGLDRDVTWLKWVIGSSIAAALAFAGIAVMSMFKLWPIMMDSWWNERFPPAPPAAEVADFSRLEARGKP